MKILITGGAGFIGSNFIHQLLESSQFPVLSSQLGEQLQIVNLDKLTYAGNLANLKDIEND